MGVGNPSAVEYSARGMRKGWFPIGRPGRISDSWRGIWFTNAERDVAKGTCPGFQILATVLYVNKIRFSTFFSEEIVAFCARLVALFLLFLSRLESWSFLSLFWLLYFGQVRFCGLTEFATGLWLGLELDFPEGKNDGSNQLKRCGVTRYCRRRCWLRGGVVF